MLHVFNLSFLSLTLRPTFLAFILMHPIALIFLKRHSRFSCHCHIDIGMILLMLGPPCSFTLDFILWKFSCIDLCSSLPQIKIARLLLLTRVLSWPFELLVCILPCTLLHLPLVIPHLDCSGNHEDLWKWDWNMQTLSWACRTNPPPPPPLAISPLKTATYLYVSKTHLKTLKFKLLPINTQITLQFR